MKVLVIAPIPPPITGHSVAATVLIDGLSPSSEVAVVNLSIGSSHDGSVSGRRLLAVGRVIIDVWRKKRGVDAIYLTVAESVAGNIKDLLIYLICVRQLSRFYIHLHGGSIKRLLFDRHSVLRALNTLAVRRMAGVIISGHSHQHIFAPMIDESRIHIVPNFAQDELFVSEQQVVDKFADVAAVRVLYISGMTAKKGYLDLADAYLTLSGDVKRRVVIDFAGAFNSDAERSAFLEKIAGLQGIRYHGLVDRETKRDLFAAAHVFCLPTTMLEGQPISILEAYASGCVVLTTGQKGIRDIFTDEVNGFEIEENSPRSIAAAIERISAMGAALAPMAMFNRSQAEARYRTKLFTQAVMKILRASR